MGVRRQVGGSDNKEKPPQISKSFSVLEDDEHVGKTSQGKGNIGGTSDSSRR